MRRDQSERATPLAARVPGGPGNVFPTNEKQRWSEGRIAELEHKIGSKRWRVIFEGVLAAHRATADAAGVNWKSAIYRKVPEKMTAGRGTDGGTHGAIGANQPRQLLPFRGKRQRRARYGHGICTTQFNRLRWSGRVTDGRELRQS